MSFSSDVKNDILSHKFKNKCCRKAFFHGALMGAEVTDQGLRIRMTDEGSVDMLTYIASTVYKIHEMDISEQHRGFSHITTICLSLPTAQTLLTKIDNCEETDDDIDALFVCNSCVTYFFCGLFCALGSASDPERSYSLELLLPNIQRAERIKRIFEEYTDLTPGMTSRSKGYGLYFRNATGVAGFLTLCQLSNLVFDYLNQEFNNQLRGDENRATNCVTHNIGRAVNACKPQIDAINKLIESNRFYLLSDELRTTAQLRMENPDIPLNALASLHNPPITKSGLNHRLKKIIQIAQEL